MKGIAMPALLVAAVLVLGAACSASTPGPAGTDKPYPVATTPTTASPGQPYPVATKAATAGGQTLMNERCTVCHSTDRIQAARKDRTGWEDTVTRMKGKPGGAQLSAAETTILIDYLAATYK